MIIAHLSDLHLGFRAYGHMERGVDVRERDVAVAWERAVQDLVRLAPNVVVVAGDVFDRPDPPAGALVTLARGLELLRTSLPQTLVLMVAGPRDTPRRPGDPGALAVLDTFPNVQAAAGLPRSILLERLDLHAALVPYRALVRDPAFAPEPHPHARWNLLVMHALEGVPGGGGVFVDPAEWDYVALGGEHRRKRVAGRVQYPGSLERVALDPWEEAADEKGFLTVDLERGSTTFHPIPGRPVVALAPIRVAPGDPDRLRRRVDEVIREVPGGTAGKIVRLRLDGVGPEDLLCLQGEQLLALRQDALHLAVEAGREPRVPTEAWLPSDAPRLLRDALLAELERDGLADPAAGELIGTLVPDLPAPAGAPGRIGVLEAVDGEIPGLGRVSTSISPGLTAVIGGAGRSRRALTGLFVGSAGVGEGPLARLWAGTGGETLDGALHQAVEAVADARGMHVVSEALARAKDLGAPGAKVGAKAGAGEERGEPAGAVRVDPELVGSELRAAERELRSLRADAAEADGDLEAASMDWHRERQDAETTLHAYRDRAREVKLRIRKMEQAGPTTPCPTCGRVLEHHYDEVLAQLKSDWEAIVQDGSWWRRRWEQLEPKPAHLQELEGRALRLHAALEATSERVELLRARLADLAGSPAYRLPGAAEGLLGHIASALLRVRDARLARARELLLSRASRYVGRISGGRILAVTWAEGTAQLQADAGPLTPLSEEDLAAGRLALRLAAASLVAAGGHILASLVVEEPFDRLDAEAAVRTLLLLRKLLREVPRIVLVTRGDMVDAQPELFDAVLEVRDNAQTGSAALRPAPAGAGRVVLGVPVEPVRTHLPQ
ncbi:MAG: metallophosphoesterase family protein [Longimicrobiales bacterium]